MIGCPGYIDLCSPPNIWMTRFVPSNYRNSLQIALEDLFSDFAELTTSNFESFF